MAVRVSLSFLTMSSLLLFAFGVISNAEDRMFKTVSVEALLPSTGDSIPRVKASGESVIRIVHRKLSSTKEARSAAFAEDSLRVASLQHRIRDEPSIPGRDASISPQRGLNIGTSNYVMSLGIGNPARSQPMIMDTSNDLSWIQCAPCMETCYSQDEPLFDPAFSFSYLNLSCDSADCTRNPSNTCFNNNTCYYGVAYGDDVYSFRFLASDTLRLPSGNVIDNFTFGCGQRNQGFSSGHSGLIGMGRGTYSLNSQLAPKVPNIFSYCLPSIGTETGYVTLGKPLKSRVGYTPMLTNPRAPSLYFLNLTGITVGGKKLNISSSVFQTAGTIIDSGTEISRLPRVAYKPLKMAFHADMMKYPLAKASTILDTCYDFSNDTIVKYPAIWLHFDGLDLVVPSTGIFYKFSSSKHCLAFAGNSNYGDVGIIGTFQQRTMEITYDNVKKRIGFAQGGCD